MKKVIYIEIDEDITSVLDRIKRHIQKIIYLVIPQKSILFESGVNLKLLKVKCQELKKRLYIVTTDDAGTQLARQYKIEVIGRIPVEKTNAEQEESPEMHIQPIQARRNEVRREQPRRAPEKKITIAEFISQFRLKRKKKAGNPDEPFYSFQPNRKFLSLILLISLGLFLLIGYIALPGATIYIRPTFDDINHTVNVVIADKRKNQNLLGQGDPHVIASEVVSTITKQTKVFNTTSQQFDGKSATGKITVINTAEEPWEFKGGTRFKTEDGLIFLSTAPIMVPAGSRSEAGELIPGKVVTTVEAAPFDYYSKPVGERGNIEPAQFSLPGLSKFNQRLVLGESFEPMAGGVTAYHKVVLSEDIEAAKKQIKDNLVISSREELEAALESSNKLNHTNLVLLDDQRYLKTELLDLRISEDLEGSIRDKFEVFAKVKAEGIAYDLDQLYTLLKQELENRSHPDKRIRSESIIPENISFEVIDENEAQGQIKITAAIVGIEEYQVDPATEAGRKLVEKIKEKVIGLDIKEAEKIIINLPEVDAVEIKTWPIWISTVPRIQDNIKVKLLEESK